LQLQPHCHALLLRAELLWLLLPLLALLLLMLWLLLLEAVQCWTLPPYQHAAPLPSVPPLCVH